LEEEGKEGRVAEATYFFFEVFFFAAFFVVFLAVFLVAFFAMSAVTPLGDKPE
jgi:hypothetical protein